MPRIGIAYQLNQKTVLRAGYGMYTAPLGTLYTNTEPAGFSLATPIQASLDNGLTFIATLANPFPNGLTQPLGPAGGLLTNIGQAVNAFPNSRKNPYAQRWSFGLQRTLFGGFLLEASYVGNRSTRLNVLRNLNFTPAQYLSTSPVRDQTAINYLGQNFPNPLRGTNPIFGATATRASLLRPYPQFGNVNIYEPIGYAWYHSLQMRLEKRFSKGFTSQTSYTWSKNMQATEMLNDQDPGPSEVVSDLDRTHRLTSSGIWELPFGKGRHWGTTWHPVLNGVAGLLRLRQAACHSGLPRSTWPPAPLTSWHSAISVSVFTGRPRSRRSSPPSCSAILTRAEWRSSGSAQTSPCWGRGPCPGRWACQTCPEDRRRSAWRTGSRSSSRH